MNIQQDRERLLLLFEEAAVAGVLLLLIPRLFSFFGIRYYPLLNRVVYYSDYQESVFGSFLADDLALICVALILLFLALGLRRFLLLVVAPSVAAVASGLISGNMIVYGIFSISAAVAAIVVATMTAYNTHESRKRIRKEKIITIFFAALVAVEVAALTRWVAYPFWPDRIYESQSWFPARLEASLFHAFGSVSVFLSMLLPLAFLLVPFRSYVSGLLRRFWADTEKTGVWLYKYKDLLEKRSSPILVGLMFLSSAFVALQFVPSVNPTNQPFGVDFYDYARRLNMLEGIAGAGNFLERAYTSNAERPLTIMILAAFQRILGVDSLLAVKLITLALGPALVFSAYRFASRAFGNKSLSLLIAFLTATSTYIVIGLYGGFVANWMAIAAVFAFLASILHFWNTRSLTSYSAALTLLIAILFIHVYTWTFLVLAMVLFLSWTYVYVRKDKGKTKMLVLLALGLAASIGVDLLKTVYGGVLAGFEVDQNLAQESVSGNMFLSRWGNLAFAVSTYLGGGLGNILPLILALIWLASMKFGNDSNRLVASLFFVAAPLMLFGDYVIQSRLLYILPVNVAMSMGAYAVAGNLQDKRASLAFLVFVVLYQLTYVMRSISNFHLVPPQ